jgi:hypothetical protein
MRCLLLITLFLISAVSLAQKTDSNKDIFPFAADTIIDTHKLTRLDSARAKLSSEKKKAEKAIDSLNVLAITTEELNHKTDSIYKRLALSVNDNLRKVQTDLPDSIRIEYNRFQKSLQRKIDFMDSIRKNGQIGSVDLRSEIGTIPDFGVNPFMRTTLPDAPSISQDLQLTTPEVNTGALPGKLTGSNELLMKVRDMTNGIKDIESVLKSIGDQKIDSAQIEKELGKRLMSNTDLSQISQAEKKLNEFETLAASIQNPKVTRDSVSTLAKDFEADVRQRFDLKTIPLDNGFSELEKYQKKYGVLADSRNLPKKRYNPLKGVPWNQRLVPGIYFQVASFQGSWRMVDVSPNLEYRFSDRFRAGIGGTYQVLMNMSPIFIETNTHYIAIRSTANYKIYGGLFANIQASLARKPDYSNYLRSGSSIDSVTSWESDVYVGLSKFYKMRKSLYGAFQVLVNPMNLKGLSKGNSVQIRFGFEYMRHE